MSLLNNSTYNELSQSLGTYLATLQIAQTAREIVNSLDHRITYAEAISYAARGELPDPKDYPDHRLDRVKDYLTQIDDIEIKSAVILSYEQSLIKNHLIYDYNNVGDEFRQARIRVILNILWDKRPHKDK
jgi:hypothetical protein